jgi:hypothetical protein
MIDADISSAIAEMTDQFDESLCPLEWILSRRRNVTGGLPNVSRRQFHGCKNQNISQEATDTFTYSHDLTWQNSKNLG